MVTMNIPIFPEKKVIIFTNYRSGSTKFAQKYTDSNKFSSTACLGEYFGWSRRGRPGEISFDKSFSNFNTYHKFCLKLMADHALYDDSRLDAILSRSSKVIYLYRRNFVNQALSYIAAGSTRSFTAGLLEEEDNDEEIVNVPYLDERFVNTCVQTLKNNYEYMAKFYHKYPGPVYCLEDLGSPSPYKKQVNWTNKPEIESYDVEGLFIKHGLVKAMA